MPLTLSQLQKQGVPIKFDKPATTTKSGLKLSQVKGAIFDTPTAPAPVKKDGILKTVGKALISNELNFGKSIADSLPSWVPGSAAWTNKQNEELMAVNQQITDKLLFTIKEKKAAGEDTTRLEAALKQHMIDSSKPPIDINETNASINKTPEQIYGEGLGVATDILASGSYGKAAEGAESGKLLVTGGASSKVAGWLGKIGVGSSKAAGALPSIAGGAAKGAMGFWKGAAQGAWQGAKAGATVGAAEGLSHGMQDNQSLPELGASTAKGTLGGAATGAVIGGVTGGASGWLNRRRDTLNKLGPSDIPPDQVQQVRDQIERKTLGMKPTYDEMAKDGVNILDDKGVLQPEEAQRTLSDLQAELDKVKPGAGKTLGTLIDTNNTTLDELNQKSHDVLDNALQIPKDVIKYNMVDGKKVLDKPAEEALNSGIDDTDVALIKNASDSDKDKFQKMFDVAKEASLDKRYTKRPVEEVGQTMIDQVEQIAEDRKNVGTELGKLRVKFAKAPVDLDDATETFVNSLGNAGVHIDEEGNLDFTSSRYARVPDVQKTIQGAFDRLVGANGAPEPTTARSVDILRQQLHTELNLSMKSATLDDTSSRMIKALYSNLGDALSEIDPKYAEYSEKYARYSQALQDFNSAMGKDFKVDGNYTALRAGEVGNRILGNASAKPMLLIGDIQDLARQAGYDSSTNLVDQVKFNDFLEDLFGTTQTRSLRGAISKGVGDAEENIQAATDAFGDAASGNIGSAIYKVARKGINLVRSITPDRQIDAVRALLAK